MSRELGIISKTIGKWRKRKTSENRKTAPKPSRSTFLNEEEKALISI